MFTTTLILLLATLSGVHADCSCYTTNASTVTGSKITISNAFDTNDFSECYSGACGFVANSGNSSVGWTSFTATFNTQTDTTGKFVIYDGQSDNANNAIIATFTVSQSGGTIALTSSTSSIYVKYTQDSSSANQYYGNLVANSGLSAPTTTTTSTAAPSTTPYTSSSFAKNPQLISHDLLILVNQKTDQGSAGLNANNELVTKFVNQLSVTNDSSATSQTRLGLATITPYKPNYAAQGEIWNMYADDVINALPKSGVSSSVNITNALTASVDAFFDVSSTIAPTRAGVQRSILLFTAWWDDTQLLSNDVKEAFRKKGVNLAIVGYNTVSTSLTSNDWYNYVSLTNTSIDDVASFVNRFYFNSNYNNALTNNWCKKSQDPNTTNKTITEPSDYSGPSTGTTWTASNGQSARYCNFQDTTYTYERADDTKNVSITVFYELEVESDYLKFFADGVEIESFTGNDVNNANFLVDASVITARFTTDNSGVERGFSATFNEV